MNILMEFCVMHGLVSLRAKKEEGFVIMCRIEKFLPLLLENVTNEQISVFKSIVSKKLTIAECICLKAHLEDMIEVFTVDDKIKFDAKSCEKHRNVYRTYLDALCDVVQF